MPKPYGDSELHRGLPSQPIREFDHVLRNIDPAILDATMSAVRRFVAQCAERGALVHVSLPQVTFRTNREVIERIVQTETKALGAHVLERVEDIPLPADHFYDSVYHLTGAAGRERTADLIRRLQGVGRSRTARLD